MIENVNKQFFGPSSRRPDQQPIRVLAPNSPARKKIKSQDHWHCDSLLSPIPVPDDDVENLAVSGAEGFRECIRNMPEKAKTNSCLTVVEPTGLTKEETRRYEELTGIIEKGSKIFVDVGDALLEVRDRKLYRGEFSSFEAFVKKNFGFTKAYSYRLISGAQYFHEIEKRSPIGDGSRRVLPVNEAQVRPLYQLTSEDDRVKAWQHAAEAAPPGRPPTAALVSAAVKKSLADQSAAEEPESVAKKMVDDANAEFEDAILADGSKRPRTLAVNGYVDAKYAQQKLDEIRDRCPANEKRKLVLQEEYIELVSRLNARHAEDPTLEMRDGFNFLIRDILFNLPVVVAKPGDFEPRDSKEKTGLVEAA